MDIRQEIKEEGIQEGLQAGMQKGSVQKLYVASFHPPFKEPEGSNRRRALRNINNSLCEKGVQKLRHAFCHARVL